jgi:thioredoxin 1
MAILKSLAVVASIVGLVGIGTVVRRTVDSKASPVCSESSCQLCKVAGASVDGSCSCGQCSDSKCFGHVDGTSFVFEGKAPACSACAHEPNVVPDGEFVPGEITDMGDVLNDTLDDNLVTATDATFAEYVNAKSGMVLVDFYADWCGPCRLQSTILDEFVKSHPEATIVKVDIDDSPELAERFAIVSIPTLVMLRNGETVAIHTGLADSDKLQELTR